MERDIRGALAKLERLVELTPQEDPKTVKAKADLEEMKHKFSQIIFSQ